MLFLTGVLSGQCSRFTKLDFCRKIDCSFKMVVFYVNLHNGFLAV